MMKTLNLSIIILLAISSSVSGEAHATDVQSYKSCIAESSDNLLNQGRGFYDNGVWCRSPGSIAIMAAQESAFKVSGYEVFCGGVIIDSKNILTSAHCLLGTGDLSDFSRRANAGKIIVRNGFWGVFRTVNQTRDDSNPQPYDTWSYQINLTGRYKLIDNKYIDTLVCRRFHVGPCTDLAILELDTLSFNSVDQRLQSSFLNTKAYFSHPIEDSMYFAPGYGESDPGCLKSLLDQHDKMWQVTEFKQFLTLNCLRPFPVSKIDTAKIEISNCAPHTCLRNEVVITYLKMDSTGSHVDSKESFCSGDSGGGLYQPDRSKGKMALTGIQSAVISSTGNCEQENRIVTMNDSIIKWIVSNRFK
jgi:hypothetical protein